jgi:UDP-2,4-diacetamido-2,4,6-trideoxy-beta-L-altropyranose hydrolase
MSLIIRVDGNNTIMTGHIMRCLSIAKAARSLGETPVFVLADEGMLPFITNHGFEALCLHSNWNHMEAELDTLSDIIKQHRVSTLLLDSYSVTEKYMQTLRGQVRLAYLDDLNAFTYPCDILVNYNHYAPLLNYPARYAGTDTHLLLDCSYTPLRDEFSGLSPFSCNEIVQRVLITTGGSDPYNMAGELVKAIKANPSLHHLALDIVCGKLNRHAEALRELAQHYPNITIHQDIKTMARLMQASDIAVTAGGSTLYELCACGTPSIFFTFADNQKFAKMAFAASLMLYAGDVRDGQEKCVKNITAHIEHLAADFALRQAVSLKMQQLVDGKGALRLAKELL